MLKSLLNTKNIKNLKLMNRIEKILDYPQYDPIHGIEGKLPEEQNYPSLNECKPGKYKIHRIYYDNSDISNFFVEYDFKVGKLVELALHFKIDNAVLLKVDKTTIVINENIASKIFVRSVKE
jgi:hypothetical protein